MWDRTHRKMTASRCPAEELVTFGEHLGYRIPPGASVLDAGCGQGRNALYLSQAGFAVCGCDLSPVAVQVARAQALQAGATIDFQVSDLAHLPYPDDTFAAAACVHVLPYHVRADITRIVCELWRVLQPNGWLYLDLLARDDAEYGCGPKLEDHTFLDPAGMPVHFSSQQEIDECLGGFLPERVTRFEFDGVAGTRVGWTVWAVKQGRQT